MKQLEAVGVLRGERVELGRVEVIRVEQYDKVGQIARVVGPLEDRGQQPVDPAHRQRRWVVECMELRGSPQTRGDTQLLQVALWPYNPNPWVVPEVEGGRLRGQI